MTQDANRIIYAINKKIIELKPEEEQEIKTIVEASNKKLVQDLAKYLTSMNEGQVMQEQIIELL